MKSDSVSRIWVKSANSWVFVTQDCTSVSPGDLVLDASSEVAKFSTTSESYDGDHPEKSNSLLGVATLAGRPYPFS